MKCFATPSACHLFITADRFVTVVCSSSEFKKAATTIAATTTTIHAVNAPFTTTTSMPHPCVLFRTKIDQHKQNQPLLLDMHAFPTRGIKKGITVGPFAIEQLWTGQPYELQRGHEQCHHMHGTLWSCHRWNKQEEVRGGAEEDWHCITMSCLLPSLIKKLLWLLPMLALPTTTILTNKANPDAASFHHWSKCKSWKQFWITTSQETCACLDIACLCLPTCGSHLLSFSQNQLPWHGICDGPVQLSC